MGADDDFPRRETVGPENPDPRFGLGHFAAEFTAGYVGIAINAHFLTLMEKVQFPVVQFAKPAVMRKSDFGHPAEQHFQSCKAVLYENFPRARRHLYISRPGNPDEFLRNHDWIADIFQRMGTHGKIEKIVRLGPIALAGIVNLPGLTLKPFGILRVEGIVPAPGLVRHDIKNMGRQIEWIVPSADIQHT